MKITDLDHDSLDNILSYCPHRACYEIQSMRETCSGWNLLFRGGGGENTNLIGNNGAELIGEGNSLGKMVKESVRSSNLMKRVEEMYLPRVHFRISVPVSNDDSELDSEIVDDQSIYWEYVQEFKKIFGDSVRIVSDSELEIDFEMEESVLQNLEEVIEKDVAVKKKEDLVTYLTNRSINVDTCKLYHVVKKIEHEERELSKHITLVDLFNDWKNQPILNKEMKVNPCRLYKKVILHLIFTNTYDTNTKDIHLSRESTIIASNRRAKGFIFPYRTRDEINFSWGSVSMDYEVIYKFKSRNESVEDRTRIIVYHLLRNKLIPVMNETLIDLKKLFRKDLLNYVKTLESEEDLYYFLTVRENILKRYRDGLLSGKIKFPDFTNDKFNFQVDSFIIPQFLNLVGLESMDNKQRGQFLKQLLKHIYKSQVLLSDEALEEYFEKMQIERREKFAITETERLNVSFERIFFERETSTIFHHLVSFPSFPSISLEKIDEDIPKEQTLTKLTSTGQIDKCWTRACCMNRVCGICNCCAILSCWCATSCCCYTQDSNADTVQTVRGLGLPTWVGWMFNCICCYRHRIFPMLDCFNCVNQCFTVKDGVDGVEYRYQRMYLEKKNM
ncbi:Hypothetical protein NAEGRDRAFT_49040 [Naegleria gruberi]|uniref:Uncharacterized protein n=1 Tax=Naegleria gruberi TaxID=5762 RepID=D2VF62_NAEGR|nr:uncharacterized protein NAEGRDRAFT_49040 [Naegleria gruberi]EFC44628.1 Hypothetical protein NAEGRDRAFT_49040 [Naegleria gruberi]|eukprot:XP_002677372.1 Hypothetical protein NAEGRDRAFT_49040 [Naegleria gruberi strain NEG-M]